MVLGLAFRNSLSRDGKIWGLLVVLLHNVSGIPQLVKRKDVFEALYQ